MARKKRGTENFEDLVKQVDTTFVAVMTEPVEEEISLDEAIILDAPGAIADAVQATVDDAYPGFDAEFYVKSYPDVFGYPAGALSHYMLHGIHECRFGSAEELAEAIDAVTQSGRFQMDHYARMVGPMDQPVRDYLMFYPNRVSPDPAFDEVFFKRYYPNSLRRGEVPFVTYCRFFKKSWCFGSQIAVDEYATEVRQSPMFSPSYMQSQLPGLDPSLDLATYYCTEGYRIPVNPSNSFSTRAYMLHYPDIAETQINPFVHYVRYGAAEGRYGAGRQSLLREKGSRKTDRSKKTIMIVNHEASRSGAPIVGLNLARTLSPLYNVISVLMRRGALYEEYKKFSAEVVVTGDTPGFIWSAVETLTGTDTIDAAILNSIECTKFVQALVDHGVPTVSLVHEFAQYCWPFTLHARAIALSDVAIYPAEVVRNAAFQELERLGVASQGLRTVVIQPQGKCVVPISGDATEAAGVPLSILRRVKKAERPFVVMGAGWVQPRKGVDLFVEAARIAKHELGMNCLFIWVGPNYAPDTDMSVSVYLAAQVAQSDLDDVVVFVEEQPSLKPFLDLADAFFLSSRLDPFPNVAIDAIADGVPVICFKEATGIAELGRRWPDRVLAAGYNNVTEAAQFMLTLSKARAAGQPPQRVPATADLDAFLAFQNYSDDLARRLEEAIAGMAERRAIADAIYAAEKLDAGLLHASLPGFLKSPGLGAATTKRSLSALLAVCCKNGLQIGYLYPGKFAGSTDASVPAAAWVARQDLRAVAPLSLKAVRVPYSAILFLNDSKHLSAYSDFVLQMGSVERVAIIGRNIPERELELLRSVSGPKAITVKDLNDGEALEAVLSQLMAGFGDGRPVHLLATPFADAGRGPAGEPLTLSERDTEFALKALAADASLALVLGEPNWTLASRTKFPRQNAVVSGTPIPDRLVDRQQCYCRLSAGQWGEALLQQLLSRCFEDDPWDIWQALREPAAALRFEQRAIISATSGRLVRAPELLYGQM